MPHITDRTGKVTGIEMGKFALTSRALSILFFCNLHSHVSFCFNPSLLAAKLESKKKHKSSVCAPTHRCAKRCAMPSNPVQIKKEMNNIGAEIDDCRWNMAGGNRSDPPALAARSPALPLCFPKPFFVALPHVNSTFLEHSDSRSLDISSQKLEIFGPTFPGPALRSRTTTCFFPHMLVSDARATSIDIEVLRAIPDPPACGSPSVPSVPSERPAPARPWGRRGLTASSPRRSAGTLATLATLRCAPRPRGLALRLSGSLLLMMLRSLAAGPRVVAGECVQLGMTGGKRGNPMKN